MSETIKNQIDEFLRDAKATTEKRKQLFDELFSFVLDGQQWSSDELKDREADDFDSLTFNFSEDFVERYLARLFPRNPRTGVMEVGVKTYDDKDGKKTAQILESYRQNNLPALLLEQGKNFLVGGAGCFYYPQNPVTGKAVIRSLDPKIVYLDWLGSELLRMAFVEDFGGGKKKTTYWDAKNFIVIDENDNMNAAENKHGFIPFSWIPCAPKPHTHEGISKILSLYELDREANLRSSDFSKRIADNTEPHLMIFSDEVDIEKVGRGKKKKTKLGKEDDARYMELREGNEILEYIREIDDRMRRKTGLVSSSGEINSAVSGFSLAYQYSDMMDLIGFMRIFWDQAFRELNQAIAAYADFGEIESDPIYHPAMLFDSKQRVEEYQLMLDMGVISRRDAIDELRGVENAEEKLAEIEEEKEKYKVEDNNLDKKQWPKSKSPLL